MYGCLGSSSCRVAYRALRGDLEAEAVESFAEGVLDRNFGDSNPTLFVVDELLGLWRLFWEALSLPDLMDVGATSY
jgi:hypothetical protein